MWQGKRPRTLIKAAAQDFQTKRKTSKRVGLWTPVIQVEENGVRGRSKTLEMVDSRKKGGLIEPLQSVTRFFHAWKPNGEQMDGSANNHLLCKGVQMLCWNNHVFLGGGHRY